MAEVAKSMTREDQILCAALEDMSKLFSSIAAKSKQIYTSLEDVSERSGIHITPRWSD